MGALTRVRDAVRVLLGGESKASSVGPLVSMFVAGQPQYSPRNASNILDEGFTQNIIVYFCIRLIADAVSQLKLEPYHGDTELPDHPLAKLLDRPKPGLGRSRFIQELLIHLLATGNTYLEAVPSGRLLARNVIPARPSPPLELHVQRPDRVRVVPGDSGLPARYRFDAGGGSREWEVDQKTGFGLLLHVKEFHPLNDWYGFGPVEVAARWIDLHNAGGALNAALMQNQGINPYVVTLKNVTNPSQIDEAQRKFHDRVGGHLKAGLPIVTGGEIDIKVLAATLRDMQWLEGMREAARMICSAWGVPHVLVVPGESTYSNRTQGQQELWEHTALSRADLLLEDLVPWFRWLYNDPDLDLRYDRDQIEALQPQRNAKRASIIAEWQADLLTLDETRAKLGEDPVEGDKGSMFASELGAPSLGPGAVPGATSPANSDGMPGIEDPAAGGGKAITELETKRAPGDDLFPPIGAGLAAWLLLADKLVDDAPMAAELRVPVRDTLDAFARRAIEQADNGPAAFDAYADRPALEFVHELAEVRVPELIGATTRQDLAEALMEARDADGGFGQFLAAIRAVFDDAARERTATIAATEGNRAAGFGGLLGMQAAGVKMREWLSQRDLKVRMEHRELDGQVQPIDQPFRYGDMHAMGPSMWGNSHMDCNCRCYVVPLMSGDQPKSFYSLEDQRLALWQAQNGLLDHHEALIGDGARRAFALQAQAAAARLYVLTTG